MSSELLPTRSFCVCGIMLAALLWSLVDASPVRAEARGSGWTWALECQSNRSVTRMKSKLGGMFKKARCNVYFEWPKYDPRPPDKPAGANKVSMKRNCRNTSWKLNCDASCKKKWNELQVAIWFIDGSVYFYYELYKTVRCTNGYYEYIHHIFDEASGPVGADGHPKFHRIRSYYYSYTRSGRSRYVATDRFGTWLAPEGGTIALAAPGPNLLAGLDHLELRTGPGGTVDLTGYDGSCPLLVTAEPVDIYADQILLDPGVVLDDLFQPMPNVMPGQNVQDCSMWLETYPCGLGTGPKTATVLLRNLSNNAEDITVAVTDDQGWLVGGGGVFSLLPRQSVLLDIDLDIPASADQCDFCNVDVTADYGPGLMTQFDFEVRPEADVSSDGLADSCDVCWQDANPGQEDEECDGVGDVCDNCPHIFNMPQLDGNVDGIGDACDRNANGIPDDVDILSGTSEDCNSNGIPDEFDLVGPAFLYEMDDGTHENAAGVGVDAYVGWMNRFRAEPDSETITSISLAWGDTADGTPTTIYLWSDPDGDGDPTDAQVLTSATTLSTNGLTDILTVVDIADTYVGPSGTSFFAGAILCSPAGEHPCSIDEGLSHGQSWIVANTNALDPNDLGAAFMPPVLIDSAGMPGNWLIRASGDGRAALDCNTNQIPDECDIAGGASEDDNDNGTPDECEACFGDLTLDGQRDLSDYADFWLNLTGPEGFTCSLADLDGDRDVDLKDFAIFQRVFGQPCP